jgi:folate-binding protein YgfZ
MNQWQEFLNTQTIQALQPENHLCSLPNLGLLYVGGDDAGDFLQNQLSNDIHAIDANTCQISSASISKGRMYGIFRIIQIEGGYILTMPRPILNEVQARLQKFILMARVVMADISDSFARFSVSVQDTAHVADVLTLREVNEVSQTDTLICVRLSSSPGNTRYLLLSNSESEAIELWQKLGSKLTINSEDAWLYDEICAGMPSVYPQTLEAFVPQMANLDVLDGINFKKGCYPGQEIVARTRYLGKLKRRMFLARLDSDSCPQPGDELTSDQAGKADGSGKVVSAVQVDGDYCLMLFVGLIDKAQNNELTLLAQGENRLTLQALPYSLDA